MRFTKMHGLGNDYIYIDCLSGCPGDLPGLAKRLSDRHFGVGSDGLVLIMPSETADFRMRMFNPDGSEAEMCGNAIRCIGKYLFDNGITEKKRLAIETPAGIRLLDLTVRSGRTALVRVDMGKPVVKPDMIPVLGEGDMFVSEPVTLGDRVFHVTCVSMGNPHAVSYVADVDAFPVEVYGPLMEKNERYPARINSEFVEIIDRTTLKMRVWERGTGETMACGTGACAAAVASVMNGLCGGNVTVILPGGELDIEWNRNNGHVYMTGPAVKVYEGVIEEGTD